MLDIRMGENACNSVALAMPKRFLVEIRYIQLSAYSDEIRKLGEVRMARKHLLRMDFRAWHGEAWFVPFR